MGRDQQAVVIGSYEQANAWYADWPNERETHMQTYWIEFEDGSDMSTIACDDEDARAVARFDYPGKKIVSVKVIN